MENDTTFGVLAIMRMKCVRGCYEASKYSRGFETPQEINKRYGFAEAIVTDRVASYRAVLRELGALEK